MRIGTLPPIRRSSYSNRHASIPDMSGSSASRMMAAGWRAPNSYGRPIRRHGANRSAATRGEASSKGRGVGGGALLGEDSGEGEDLRRRSVMCRNIRTLYPFAPPVTGEEIEAASLQFIRKVTGFSKPSAANQVACDRAVREVAATVRRLLDSLVTRAPPRKRGGEAARGRAQAAARFGARRTRVRGS